MTDDIGHWGGFKKCLAPLTVITAYSFISHFLKGSVGKKYILSVVS